MPSNKSSLRSFVSILLLFSSIILVFTGIILFITPPGRVAHWTGWTMLGLKKDQWGAVHIIFSILVLIVSLAHVYLNFKPMVNYFKDKISKKFAFKMDWIAALVLCVAVVMGTLAAIPPFSSIMDINETFKMSWEKPADRAPMPHAESMTLEGLAKKADLDLSTLIANLKKAEMGPATPKTVIKQLSDKYDMTPNQVFRIATGVTDPSQPAVSNTPPSGSCGGGGKSGLGRKTLKQFCADENIEISAAIAKLKAAGMEAKPGETMKAIANKGLTNPHAVSDILTKE